MAQVRLEVLVEPVRENDPGEHVLSALRVLEGHGLTVEMGPFASTVEGDLATVASAVGEMIASSVDAGASALQFRVERLDAT